MDDIFYVENLDQLKALSDPFKVKILWEIDEVSKTGKMLADQLHLSPSKVRYHLTELEKVGLVKIDRTEEKNGIVQKFYRSVAKNISLEKITPYINKSNPSLGAGLKESMMISLNKTAQLLASQDIDDISDMQQVTGDYRLNKEEIERLNGMLKEIYLLLRNASQDPQKEGEKYHIHLTVFKNR
ncbi:helix-turn-helix domain-containing protein [Heyndrickxia coagulans]|jgi:DNA-binding transcriptional ArsR family regulator|uniref:ArsR/SmtB family transcription factor n=1 Tax=Heyndrickxia coagulans TaxID=1398 RepID=UPI002E1C063E|nr:helix-turn-helix domain-containing protein [Heyndrickxia coagulans]MED4963921.1 helix-turn-helix domain-containing protein [Heyndrickxia coagulans]